MDNLFVIPDSYDSKYLDFVRCRPFIDSLHESLIKNIIGKKLSYPEATILDDSYTAAGANPGLTKPIFETFKKEFRRHLEGSTLNQITGFDSFVRDDICLGCTQYMDNLHIRHDVQVLSDEYRYHRLLNPNISQTEVGSLIPNKPLIISIPFSIIGKVHERMDEILQECLEKNIDLHLDGAWITAAKNVNIDLSHPAIKSFAVSMSKGYGLAGWNRIGVRWVKEVEEDSITIMNDYSQINTMCVVVGNYFLNNVDPDHLWNTHGENHYKLCFDFDLTPSDTIHMATKEGHIVGLTPLLMRLENNV